MAEKARERAKDPASALGNILSAITKKKRAEEDLRMAIMKERMKGDEKFARDIVKMGIQNQYKQKSEELKEYRTNRREGRKSMAELHDPTATWKGDVKKDARGQVKEQRYRDLYKKKQTGRLTPTEEAQFKIVSKDVTGTATTDMTPYQKHQQSVSQGNAIMGLDALFDAADRNNGVVKNKGVDVPVTRDFITRYINKYYKKADMSDVEIQTLIDRRLELMPKKKRGWLKQLLHEFSN